MKRFVPILILVVAAPVQGQSAPDPAQGVNATKFVWQMAQGFVQAAAQQMPEAKYSYRPTPEVRTFGEIVGHVAGAQYMFCAAALGDPPRAEDAVETTKTTKAELIAALKASTEYCNRAYAMTDAAAGKSITLFGMKMNSASALALNAAHDYEHYGNIVTYLRMNNMVPPSSQPAK